MLQKIIFSLLMSFMTLFTIEIKAQYTDFEHDGITRQYIYYEPETLNQQMPLVIVMHGYTGDANSIKNYSEMNDFADQYGFAVCYPRGTVDGGGNRFWNVGYAFHQNETVDDVGYLTELTQYLQQTNGLNPDYTFATGMSNGGEMCYMLACQAYDTFKAVAPVAGMILQDILDDCDAAPGIPVFEIHGSQDGVTPLAGDPDNNDGWGSYPSIADTIDYFVEKNGCTTLVEGSVPNTNTSDGSFIVSEKYINGVNQNEVWYYKVVGGGHDWPGSGGNMDIEAGEQAWLFFQNYIDNNVVVLDLDAAISVDVPEINCGDTIITPSVSLTNYGLNNITVAQMTWQINDGDIQTINFNGTLSQNQTQTFTLDPIDLTEGSYVFNASLISVNGVIDQNTQNNDAATSFDIGGNVYLTQQITLELLTDDYAEETSWEFREIGGAILDSGSYNQSDDNTTFIETFGVVQDNCYEFEIFDAFGDGICCEFGEGFYSLTTDSGDVVFDGGEFGGSEITEISIGEELSTSDAFLSTISLYPNPANNEITLSIGNTNDISSYRVYTTFGQLLQEGTLQANKEVISVSRYTVGIYFVVVKNTATSVESTLRFIKE
ncbi:T9SS type A sorting domain-containing protein [Flavobacteriaceae bacterium]|nr:T9SS type A sorting domain-containing protein [Flavobacteriaceae bacterium]